MVYKSTKSTLILRVTILLVVLLANSVLAAGFMNNKEGRKKQRVSGAKAKFNQGFDIASSVVNPHIERFKNKKTSSGE